MQISAVKLFAGATWKWTESLADYPASVYLLKFLFKLPGQNSLEVSATAAGDVHSFSIPSATTANYASGKYFYQALIIHRTTNETTVFEQSTVEVLPLLSASNVDPRGYWEKLLADLRAAYLVAAKNGWAEMMVDGVTVKYSRADLLKEIETAEYYCEQEKRAAKGQGGISKTFITFGGN